jgi:broad specificity phosphatase PhoE
MKKHTLLLIFVFTSLLSCTTEETTTYYLIRHAEIVRTDATNRNPNLNDAGKERAANWGKYFKNIDLEAVYSTKYNRTLQTATPTAERKNLPIQKYDPRKMYTEDFAAATKGKTVLIVGHSNTTPVFANKILGEQKYKNMDDHDNASLYIVTVIGTKKTSRIEILE